jgi:hypothetical protein
LRSLVAVVTKQMHSLAEPVEMRMRDGKWTLEKRDGRLLTDQE